MCSLPRRAHAFASRANRDTMSGTSCNSGWMNLIATVSSSSMWRAATTTPIAPCPSTRTTSNLSEITDPTVHAPALGTTGSDGDWRSTGMGALFHRWSIPAPATETMELAVFACVVKHSSYAKAAEELRLSPSGVSRIVTRLEDRLGARLIQRTTRKLSLTEAGTAFHARGAQILLDLADAEAEVQKTALHPRGTLRLSASVVFGRRYLAPVLKQLTDRFPELSFDLSLSNRFVDLVEEGIDLAIRIGALADSRLIARRLCTNRRILVDSPDYLAARGVPQSLGPRAARVRDLQRLVAAARVEADRPRRPDHRGGEWAYLFEQRRSRERRRPGGARDHGGADLVGRPLATVGRARSRAQRIHVRAHRRVRGLPVGTAAVDQGARGRRL